MYYIRNNFYTYGNLYPNIYTASTLLSRIKRPANVRNCIGRVLVQIKKKKKEKKKKETCVPFLSSPFSSPFPLAPSDHQVHAIHVRDSPPSSL